MPDYTSGCQLGLEIPPTHPPLLQYILWANPPRGQGIATVTQRSVAVGDPPPRPLQREAP